jgi:SAM-dependent methyltransferase
MGFARRLTLNRIYASHNSARSVRGALTKLLASLHPTDWAANVGAGSTHVHPQAINIDLFDEEGIDVVTRGHELPFSDGSLKLVVSQEVVEHLEKPAATISEVHRVLQRGGIFYCQVPFVIGYHPGPHDYWRFTKEGLPALFDAESWEVLETRISVGHGTGFYRIAVEFFAVTSSALHRALYLPTKAAMALLLFPLKLADLVTPYAPEADRIPGGYFCIVRKR